MGKGECHVSKQAYDNTIGDTSADRHQQDGQESWQSLDGIRQAYMSHRAEQIETCNDHYWCCGCRRNSQRPSPAALASRLQRSLQRLRGLCPRMTPVLPAPSPSAPAKTGCRWTSRPARMTLSTMFTSQARPGWSASTRGQHGVNCNPLNH